MDGNDTVHRLHQLVLIHGRERAREMVPEKQRSLVDIAAEVMSDESQRIGISYTGFCLTSLPHKRLPDDHTWEKKGKIRHGPDLRHLEGRCRANDQSNVAAAIQELRELGHVAIQRLAG